MFGFFHRPQGPQGPAGNVGGDIVEELAIQKIVGYRTWFIQNHNGGLALQSIHVQHVWLPGQNTAICHPSGNWWRQTEGKHEAPNLNCSCGFYAQLPDQPFTEWTRDVRARVSASGQIEMWGRIIQCERGYKAQHVELERDAPVVLETSCQAGCDNTPRRVQLPGYKSTRYWSYCEDHIPEESDRVTVEAGAWLQLACEELSERYEREFIHWHI